MVYYHVSPYKLEVGTVLKAHVKPPTYFMSNHQGDIVTNNVYLTDKPEVHYTLRPRINDSDDVWYMYEVNNPENLRFGFKYRELVCNQATVISEGTPIHSVDEDYWVRYTELTPGGRYLKYGLDYDNLREFKQDLREEFPLDLDLGFSVVKDKLEVSIWEPNYPWDTDEINLPILFSDNYLEIWEWVVKRYCEKIKHLDLV